MTWLLKGHAPDWEFNRLDEEYRGPISGPDLHDVRAGQLVVEYDADAGVCRTVLLVLDHELRIIEWPDEGYTGFGLLMKRIVGPLHPGAGVALPDDERDRVHDPAHSLHTFVAIDRFVMNDLAERLVAAEPGQTLVELDRASVAQMFHRFFGANVL